MPLVVAMALSGLDADQWNDELRDMYEKGAQLVSKPYGQFSSGRLSTSSPGASSVASSHQSLESGISSLSPNSAEFINQFSHTPFELTYPVSKVVGQRTVEEIEKELIPERSSPKPGESTTTTTISAPISPTGSDEAADRSSVAVPLSVIYEKRNILDLGNHIRCSHNFVRPAVIPKGVSRYFENRSQISRLSGAEPPSFRIHKCSFSGCNFLEPRYY